MMRVKDRRSSMFKELIKTFDGEFYNDEMMRTLYATDASVYKEMPLAVAIPKSKTDIQKLIFFAQREKIPLIPRAAGTSLAGQVVGHGIIVDICKYLNRIIEINRKKKWVRLEPGVNHSHLNETLKPFKLFFGPETSTSNRCTLGGMVGNNACGAHSIVYGNTRDHLLSTKGFLADGSEVEFSALNQKEFLDKTKDISTASEQEREIYRFFERYTGDDEMKKEIEKGFPKKEIHRRNTGYALDLLMDCQLFDKSSSKLFNLSNLIAGSEGTLFFMTEIKLNLVETPPEDVNLICVHCRSLEESFLVNQVALEHQARACELIDHYILDCTETHIDQRQNRNFIKGNPRSVLIVELAAASPDLLQKRNERFIRHLKAKKWGYHFPVLVGKDMEKVWNLRKAGLGLLSNIPGDAKPVAVIEDTAVAPEDMLAYISDFNRILKKYAKEAVHYGHAASGELHLRPILNLKDKTDRKIFRQIAEDISFLAGKYRGSLSGEHGDGRLRGEFISRMVGEKNYQLMKEVKKLFDPNGLFNPGKITDAPSMDTFLRYHSDQKTPEVKTFLNFDTSGGLLRSVEMCNGSGDCRKLTGTMCPSYQATLDEKMTTRARANYTRERLYAPLDKNDTDDPLLHKILDYCLSCKGCKAECPSNVDMAKVKAEITYRYHLQRKPSWRHSSFGHFEKLYNRLQPFASIYNWVIRSPTLSNGLKSMMGMALGRSLPRVSPFTLREWYKRKKGGNFGVRPIRKFHKKIVLFCDEFTNRLDVRIGINAVKFFTALGYRVELRDHLESARSLISKGFLEEARERAEKNLECFWKNTKTGIPLVGIEPSAILGFRDEYPDLVSPELRSKALDLSRISWTFEEFVYREMQAGFIDPDYFSKKRKHLLLHVHCHQKALTQREEIKSVLSLPSHFDVEIIDSGCCGMAGSFGYEKEKFDLSMKIGELILFPTIRKDEGASIIVATGTSCRHQIKDAIGCPSFHSAEVLWKALKKEC